MKKVSFGLALAALVCAAAVLGGCVSEPTAQSYYKEGLKLERKEYLFGQLPFGQLPYVDEEVVEKFNKAIEIDPHFAEAYLERGRALIVYFENYRHRMDFSGIIADFSKAIEIKPNLVEAYRLRGVAYYYKEQYSEAIADFSKAIEIKPNLVGVYWLRGRAYFYKEQYSEAIADYTKAVKLSPDSMRYKDALASAKEALVKAPAARIAEEKKKADKEKEELAKAEAARIAEENARIAEEKEKAEEEAERKYIAERFILAPASPDFKRADYTKVDLFEAVADSEKLEVISTGSIFGYYYSSIPSIDLVSDVIFVRQDVTDITFRNFTGDVTRTMWVGSRTGLQSGQRVRIYYRAYRIKPWEIIAIERL